MDVSIIIPTLNEEKNLGNLLYDISNQDFSKHNIEVLVADAGSIDNTRMIAERYGAKIIRGGHPSEARNNGAANALGHKLYFMDADIHIKPEFLTESYIEFIARKLDVAGMDNHPIYYKDDKLSDKIIISTINYLANKLIFRMSEDGDKPKAVGTCMIFNKNAFLDNGGFDENIYWGEDTEIVERMKNNDYKFGILRKSDIYTRPRKILEHGIWNYYTNAIKLNNYRQKHGEIRTKEQYQQITGIKDYFKIEKKD